MFIKQIDNHILTRVWGRKPDFTQFDILIDKSHSRLDVMWGTLFMYNFIVILFYNEALLIILDNGFTWATQAMNFLPKTFVHPNKKFIMLTEK